jgi:beta-glucanase (GH16 family)
MSFHQGCFKRRIQIVAAVTVAIGLLLLPSISRADGQAGKNCLSIGKTSLSAGKRFTCVKVGKKTVWNKGIALPATGPQLTMRLTSPELASANGQSTNFMNLTESVAIGKWLTNFAPDSKVYQIYTPVGGDLKTSWHVRDTKTGLAFANSAVWLVVNANEGSIQRTSFTYEDNDGTHVVKANSNRKGQTQIPGKTDQNGNVTFILQDTNSIGEAEPTPIALNQIQATQNINLFSSITLTAHSSAIRETRDFLNAHFVKPSDTLLWSDEFSEAGKVAPSSDTWNLISGDGCPNLCGWGNGEVEYYKESANRTDGNGHLVITTKALSPTTTYSCYPDTCQWSSGKIDTQGKVTYKYGLIEARIKVPAGGGTWPAFWMLGTNITTVPWPLSGEIDIMEAAGNEPYKISGTAHLANSRGQHIYKGDYTYTPQLTASGYHTFGVAWLPNRIDWLVDGIKYYSLKKRDVGSSPWPFNDPFYIIVNTAMGGGFGGLVDWSLTSAKTSIDWIRVYQNDHYGCVTTETQTLGNCSES